MNSENRAGFMDSNTAHPRQGIRGFLQTTPRKVKALRREGPKRGARELPEIIGRLCSLVNTDAVRKYPALTVGKAEGARITIRKKRRQSSRTDTVSRDASDARWSDVQLRDVDVAELDRRRQLVFVHQLDELEDVSDPRQVDGVLPGELLNRLQLHDVALREAPAVGRGPLGDDQPEVFVHHQRAR